MKSNLTKRSLICLLLGLSILFNFSCSKKQSLPIPKDAAIGMIDVFTLIEKSQVLDSTKYSNMRTLIAAAGIDINAEINDKSLNDLSKEGIDNKSKVYIFSSADNLDKKCIGAALKLTDEKKFEVFLKDLTDGSGMELTIEEKDAYKLVSFMNKVVMVWNNNSFLLLASPDNNLDFLKQEADRLMKLKEEERIANLPEFQKFNGTQNDFSMWIPMTILEKLPNYNMFKDQMPFDLKGNYATITLNFEKDQIALAGRYFLNKEAEKLVKENPVLKDMNKELLKFLPEQSIAELGYAIDFKNYLSLLKKSPQFGMLAMMFQGQTGISLEDLFSDFGGSTIFTMSDYKTLSYLGNSVSIGNNTEIEVKEKEMPILNMVFDLNKNDNIMKLVDMIPAEMLEKHDNYYEVYLPMMPNFYFAFNDKFGIASNELETVKAFNNGGLQNNLNFSPLKDDIIKYSAYANMYVNKENLPQSINDLVQENFKYDRDMLIPYKIWNDYAIRVDMKTIDSYSFKISLHTKQIDSNSLSSLFSAIDKNIPAALGN
ncbi:MAG: DUF4836 family protein [Hyphomicrobiales bacterium]